MCNVGRKGIGLGLTNDKNINIIFITFVFVFDYFKLIEQAWIFIKLSGITSWLWVVQFSVEISLQKRILVEKFQGNVHQYNVWRWISHCISLDLGGCQVDRCVMRRGWMFNKTLSFCPFQTEQFLHCNLGRCVMRGV